MTSEVKVEHQSEATTTSRNGDGATDMSSASKEITNALDRNFILLRELAMSRRDTDERPSDRDRVLEKELERSISDLVAQVPVSVVHPLPLVDPKDKDARQSTGSNIDGSSEESDSDSGSSGSGSGSGSDSEGSED